LRLRLDLLTIPAGVSCLPDVESATKGNCGVDAHTDGGDIVLAVLMITAAFPRDSRISNQFM
jgi:hypothetical protein